MTGADETAALLARADAEFRRGLHESVAFERMERSRRRRSVLGWGVAVSGACAAGLLFVRLATPSDPPERHALTREPPVAPVPRREVVEPPRPDPAPSPPVPAATVGARRGEVSAERVTPPPTEDLCQTLAKDGKGQRAVDCYRVLGRARDVSGDVALYHAARLSLEQLGDAPRALAFLDEHEQRFPSSSLSAEVDWLKTRSLHRVGRTDEALAASEALLSGPAGRTLSADLHWLRARIFQDERGDCTSAVSELVALVGEPGARGDEAELRRARCLEKLGRSTDARAAYQHYLERPGARHSEEARTRLSVLPP
jgi:tetratricopeptide (TPR) repeat protein